MNELLLVLYQIQKKGREGGKVAPDKESIDSLC
jgi:hypothetical protein